MLSAYCNENLKMTAKFMHLYLTMTSISPSVHVLKKIHRIFPVTTKTISVIIGRNEDCSPANTLQHGHGF